MNTLARVVVEGQGTFVRVRKPAYWLFVALIGFGLVSMGRSMADALNTLSTVLWISAVLNGAVAVAFIWILARMDLFEREPAAVRAAAFLWGALVATSVGAMANNSLLSLIAKVFGSDFASRWGAALAGPTNEEWVKVLGVVILVLIVREHFNRSIDGLIYGAMCGLGFQFMENMIYAVNNAFSNPNSDWVGALSVTIVRIVVAGPWSHPIYTGVAGLGVAFAVTQATRPAWVRYGVAAGLFVLAWAMHFVWNSPIPFWLPDGLTVLLVYGKGVLILVFFLLLYRYAAGREWDWFVDIMRGQPETVITPGEVKSMKTLGSRRKARKEVGDLYGVNGRRMVERLQRSQIELGEALARARRAEADPDSALDVTVARANIHSIREEMASWEGGVPRRNNPKREQPSS
ncbi:MAG: PrsW family intramembrane metalloprotease [Stackebrandtia sp.]